MFILGHVGITVGVVHAIDRRADLRLVALTSLLPDFVDKPLDVLLPDFANGWTRTIGHAVVGWAAFALVLLVLRGVRSGPYLLAYSMHLFLDRMWLPKDRHTLFWPFLGTGFPFHHDTSLTLLRALRTPWVGGGELVGLACLVALAVKGRLWRVEARRTLLATGVLDDSMSVARSPASCQNAPKIEA